MVIDDASDGDAVPAQNSGEPATEDPVQQEESETAAALVGEVEDDNEKGEIFCVHVAYVCTHVACIFFSEKQPPLIMTAKWLTSILGTFRLVKKWEIRHRLQSPWSNSVWRESSMQVTQTPEAVKQVGRLKFM